MAQLEDRIRMDLLYRLRWDLLADLHDIKIAVEPPNEERPLVSNDSSAASVWESTGFGPTNHVTRERRIALFGHSSADEDLAVPGLSRMEVANRECLHKFYNSFDGSPEPDGYRPPPSLIIENEDGKPITLGQFVTEVHSYLNKHIDEIKKALGAFYTIPVDERIFFRRVWISRTDDDNIRLSVSLTPTTKGDSMEQFWTIQLNYARMHQQKRDSQSCGFQNPSTVHDNSVGLVVPFPPVWTRPLEETRGRSGPEGHTYSWSVRRWLES